MIGQFFGWLFHTHKWKIIKEELVTFTREGKKTHSEYKYILQCEKCGNIKDKNISPW